MRSWAWISFISLFLVGAKWYPGGDQDRITSPQREDMVTRVSVAGMVIPERRNLFMPPYNAYIRKIHVKLGERVKAGSPVVSLGQTLKGAGEEPHPMRAPFTGTVVQVLRAEGEYVEAGKEGNGILRMDDISRMYVQSDIPESDIGRIKKGQEVVIRANGVLDREYHGTIQSIALAAKDKKDWSRTGDRVEFEVKIAVNDKDDRLKPGMSAIVDIITGSRENVLTLPHEFIERRGEEYFVRLEKGEERKVEVGFRNDEKVEIVKGVSPGDKVRMVDFFALPEEG